MQTRLSLVLCSEGRRDWSWPPLPVMSTMLVDKLVERLDRVVDFTTARTLVPHT